MTLLKAIFTHIVLLLTFQHDGRGLPQERTGNILMYILGVGFSALTNPPESWLSFASAVLIISPVIAYMVLGKDLFAGTMLAGVIGACEQLLFQGAGLNVPHLLVTIHVMFMVVSLMYKQTKRLAQEKGVDR